MEASAELLGERGGAARTIWRRLRAPVNVQRGHTELEGTVLKRPASLYRPGRHSVWLKHKARHVTRGVLRAVGQDREGRWYGICDVAGRRVTALTGATAADQLGEPAVLVYSRVDASGGLREVRIVADAGAADASRGGLTQVSFSRRRAWSFVWSGRAGVVGVGAAALNTGVEEGAGGRGVYE